MIKRATLAPNWNALFNKYKFRRYDIMPTRILKQLKLKNMHQKFGKITTNLSGSPGGSSLQSTPESSIPTTRLRGILNNRGSALTGSKPRR